MRDFSTLDIEHVIIHEIKKQKKSDNKAPPKYSEIESTVTDRTKTFLKNKFVDTVGSSKAYEVLFDDEAVSEVPDFVKSLIDNEYAVDVFLDASKKIASQLNEEQTGKNPGGFILLLYGINRGSRVIGILKLEKEEGAQLKETEKDGKKTFEITNIDDLILSKYTKLFKIGVFYENNSSYEGKVCDNQLTGKGDVANFFLQDFLGCVLKEDPAVLTKNFYFSSLDFVKEVIEDPLVQRQCKIHLQSYISNQSNTINPRQFALNYLEPDHRTNYENYLRERNVPIQNIIKRTTYVDRFISKSLYEFENGIQIIGKSSDIEDNVSLEPLDEGKTRAVIESRLKNI